jgi:hypothetical protein
MVRSVRSLTGVAFAAIILAPGVASPAAGSDIVTQDMHWRGGERLAFQLPARVTFTPGPVAQVKITGPAEALDRIYLDGDVVRQKPSMNGWWGRNSNWMRNVTIVATGPSVRDISGAASADVEVKALDGPSLRLSASSSAHVRANNVRTADLRASASSSGSVEARGAADRVDVSVSSSGRVDLGALTVKDATIAASSSGGAIVSPSRSADARASSSGHVRLLQRPPTFNSQTSSSGSIRVG